MKRRRKCYLICAGSTQTRTFPPPSPLPNFRHSFIGLDRSVQRMIACLDG